MRGDKQPQSCRVDLLTVMFAKVIVARCSVVRGERQGGDESAAGLRAGRESEKDEWGLAAAAACLREWL
jgi:hypothetical protein